MSAWNDERDAKLLKLRRMGVTFRNIGIALDVSASSASGRWHALNGTYRALGGPSLVHEPKRIIREVKPSKTPFATDISTPKFANHELHLALIGAANNGRGFPVLNLPPAYRVAA